MDIYGRQTAAGGAGSAAAASAQQQNYGYAATAQSYYANAASTQSYSNNYAQQQPSYVASANHAYSDYSSVSSSQQQHHQQQQQQQLHSYGHHQHQFGGHQQQQQQQHAANLYGHQQSSASNALSAVARHQQQMSTPRMYSQHWPDAGSTGAGSAAVGGLTTTTTTTTTASASPYMSPQQVAAAAVYRQQQQQQHQQQQQQQQQSQMFAAAAAAAARLSGAPATNATGAVPTGLGTNPGGAVASVEQLPVKMLVDARHVGAIIGQGGQNIRELVRDCRARCVVDPTRGPRYPPAGGGNASQNSNNLYQPYGPDGQPVPAQPQQPQIMEKVISISGLPESCSRAVLRILEICQHELDKEQPERTDTDVELRLRAHNTLVGRLIGRQGTTIKRIMQETGTTIFVSNANESNGGANGQRGPNDYHSSYEAANLERTITVKAPTLDAVSEAEKRISARLRQSYELDLQNRSPYLIGGPTAAAAAAAASLNGPFSMMPFFNPFVDAMSAGRVGGAGSAYPTPIPGAGILPHHQQQQQQSKVVRIYVPDIMVGAIIGGKGAHIKGVMRMTCTSIRVEGSQSTIRKDAAAALAATGTTNSETPTVGNTSSEDGTVTNDSATETGATANSSPTRRSATPPDQSGASAEQQSQQTPDAGTPQPQQQPPLANSQSYANQQQQQPERLVTIYGADAQNYKAQFWLYHKVAEQSRQPFEDVQLRTEILVPSRFIGRIIGKGGSNVRELQKLTGAVVKIPSSESSLAHQQQQQQQQQQNSGGDQQTEGAAAATAEQQPTPESSQVENASDEKKQPQAQQQESDDTMATVRIFANFHSSVQAQMRLTHLVNEGEQYPRNYYDRRAPYSTPYSSARRQQSPPQQQQQQSSSAQSAETAGGAAASSAEVTAESPSSTTENIPPATEQEPGDETAREDDVDKEQQPQSQTISADGTGV